MMTDDDVLFKTLETVTHSEQWERTLPKALHSTDASCLWSARRNVYTHICHVTMSTSKAQLSRETERCSDQQVMAVGLSSSDIWW